VLSLLMRKFFCDTRECPRRIFTERLPDFIQPWARITNRLCRWQEAIGFATSGEAGSRLAQQGGIVVAPTTLLRRIMAHPIAGPAAVSHIGIDDFAFRRGRKYGTLLVDLQSHRIVELLPDRTTPSAAAWFAAHPEVEVISRDRGTDYAAAARQGAPQALQVADRFHVVKNLAEAVELALARGWPQINREVRGASGLDSESADAEEDEVTQAAAPDWRPPVPRDRELQQLARQAERLKRYEQVISLRSLGLKPAAIARRLGTSARTIRRWLAVGMPEAKRRRRKRSAFDPYAPYVLKRWQEGYHNGLQLWRELQAQGYRHSARMVYRFLESLRDGTLPVLPNLPLERKPSLVTKKEIAAPPPSPLETLSARQAVWLFVRESSALDDREQETLGLLLQGSRSAKTIYQLVQDFVAMVREHQGKKLDDWLGQVASSHLPDLRRFAVGIERDKAAVLAGLSSCYSNGVVEGQVHRIKLLKRMMYGRAGFDLLRQRVLHAA
jgi:transposase